jgi:hypothetical protein
MEVTVMVQRTLHVLATACAWQQTVGVSRGVATWGGKIVQSHLPTRSEALEGLAKTWYQM